MQLVGQSVINFAFVCCNDTSNNFTSDAYLNKLLHSLKTNKTIPFPTRSPYNSIGGEKGFLFPVRICIIGVISSDRKGLKDTYQKSNILHVSPNRSHNFIPTKQQINASRNAEFELIGGSYNAKKMLEDVFTIDERKKKILKQFGLFLPNCVLLYGPPGTGKTLLAKATLNLLRNSCNNLESEESFIPLNASDIVCSEIGKSEKLLTSTFEIAQKKTPSVIFIDEFQALFTSRDNGNGTTSSSRLTSTLLTLMDEISESEEDTLKPDDKRVIVLAATNTPWLIDRAFLRRFNRVSL